MKSRVRAVVITVAPALVAGLFVAVPAAHGAPAAHTAAASKASVTASVKVLKPPPPVGPQPAFRPTPLHGATNGTAHFDELPRAGTPATGNSATQGNAVFNPAPGTDMTNPPKGSAPGTAQGPVMTTPVVYNIFWLPSGNHFESDNLATSDTRYENLMNQAVRDLGNNDYFAVNTQYSGSNGTPANALTFGGSIVVTTAYPHAGTAADPLLEKDINDEVNSVTSAQHWPTTINDLYAVYTASGIEECDKTTHDNCTPGVKAGSGNFCAYHEFVTPPHAYMPSPETGSSCARRAPATSPNSDRIADSEIEVFSHELFESITDPNGNAWQGTGGASAEIGDLCNGQNGYVNPNGANAYLGSGHAYTVELQWSNAVHGCVESLKNGSVTPPSVTVSKTVDNAAPQVGQTVTYTISATNSSDTGPATNLEFTDTLPPGYTVTDVNDPGSFYDDYAVGGNQAVVGYDHLAVHETVTFTISARVPDQPLKTATNCASLTLQNEVTVDVASVTSSPCASVTPKDQAISLTAVAAHGVEGTSTIALATLTDPDPNGTAGEYAASVDWGDGSSGSATIVGPVNGPWTVQAAHTYAEEGAYKASVTVRDVSDDPSNVASTPVTVTVADAALTATAGTGLTAVEGASWSGTVATFTDADPDGQVGDYTASIDWGDGTTTPGVVSGGPVFAVTGTHTYLEEGSYLPTVSISDAGGATATAHPAIAVADAPLTASGLSYSAPNPFSGTVATFSDADPNGTLSDYSATINWGDGTPVTAGVLSTVSGGFAVSGSHTFAATGATTYTVHVHICDVGGACADATTTLRITYMTGHAYGLAVNLSAGTRHVHVGPIPDTGAVSTTLASTTHTPCTLSLYAGVVTAGSLCANVTTHIAPDSSTATATLSRATVSLGLGLPVISVVGLSSTSTSSCDSSSGGIKIVSLVIGGRTINVTGAVNLVIALPGVAGAKLVVNEQTLTTGPNGDKVLTVNGLHLLVPTAAGIVAEAVLASATSDIHNCAAPVTTQAGLIGRSTLAQ